jgi:sugar-specific transcriptional regulator TrmB
LDFNDTEIKIYIYLATVGPQKLADICSASGYNKKVVVNYLKRLKAKDLVEIDGKLPRTYRAMDIKVLLNLLVISINIEIQQLEKIQNKYLKDPV